MLTEGVKSARAAVLEWLRENDRDVLPATINEMADAQIAGLFLSVVERSGFVLELVNNASPAEPAWVGHWTWRGSAFEGFKQPHDHSVAEAARLLACAALLRNEWCRHRLSAAVEGTTSSW